MVFTLNGKFVFNSLQTKLHKLDFTVYSQLK